MGNKYVDFISDEHFLKCVSNLHNIYLKASKEVSKKRFYKNKVDVFKLTFDAKFNEMSEEDLIKAEILRQIDKTINNPIGTFHEEILGGVEGYEKGNLSGFDIKAINNTVFADLKNKHNTMNSSSSESLFQKLKNYADTYKNAKCYWVQILAKNSFEDKWTAIINRKEYSHSRVFKISGDKFYELLTKQPDALFKLYKALPTVINDYLESIAKSGTNSNNSVLEEIKSDIEKSKRSILDQITSDNYKYYTGFEEL